jgi:IPT/TIG domain
MRVSNSFQVSINNQNNRVPEAGMRVISILLATLVIVGCGAGNGKAPVATKVSTVVLPPAITALAPISTPSNSAPFLLTINGSNFGTDSIVFWNNVPHTANVISSRQLLVALNSNDLMSSGLVPVFVRSAGLNSNTMDFVLTIQ